MSRRTGLRRTGFGFMWAALLGAALTCGTGCRGGLDRQVAPEATAFSPLEPSPMTNEPAPLPVIPLGEPDAIIPTMETAGRPDAGDLASRAPDDQPRALASFPDGTALRLADRTVSFSNHASSLIDCSFANSCL